MIPVVFTPIHGHSTRVLITFEVFTLPASAAHAHKRQKERAAKGQPGDDVPYVLAWTIRSNIQYNAAIALKAKGGGNQCRRGTCMKRAMSMFCGKNGEGTRREVVLALARY